MFGLGTTEATTIAGSTRALTLTEIMNFGSSLGTRWPSTTCQQSEDLLHWSLYGYNHLHGNELNGPDMGRQSG